MELKPLDKVWILSNSHVYPGVILSIVGPVYIVLKFDTAIWRRVICTESEISHRKNDFSDHMFKVRQNFIAA